MKVRYLVLLISLIAHTAMADNNSTTNNNTTNTGGAGGNANASTGSSTSTSNSSPVQNVDTTSSSISTNHAEQRQNAATTSGSSAYITTGTPAATATAPAMVAGGGTCLGSASIGGQGMTFGFSAGKTLIDEDCVRRQNAALLYNFGQTRAALELLCHNKEVEESLHLAGVECGRPEVSEDLECTYHTYNGGQYVCKGGAND